LPASLPSGGIDQRRRVLAAASGRQEARVLFRSTIGAHAASSHRRWIGLALAGSLIAGLAVAPGAGASTATLSDPSAATTIALTTTTVDAPWYTTERFAFGLINCDRTGGWILADGTCRGYGSGHYSAYVRPLGYSSGLSNMVSRPYAKLLVTRSLCTHTASGDPGVRLRRAGYLSWTWGENIGCRDGYSTAKAAVLASLRAFQAEKSANGGHWRNIKNTKYRSIGVGVWRSGSRTRLVLDFYA
jgi:hypothetical protein